MSKEYSDKLKDPRWQRKRLAILERDGWKCMACGEKEKTLHVHHIFYIPNVEPWAIPDGLLITFCEDCHNPKRCEKSPCETCEYSNDPESGCLGDPNPKEEIQEAIGSLLNLIWSKDKQGDFFSSLGRASVEVSYGKN